MCLKRVFDRGNSQGFTIPRTAITSQTEQRGCRFFVLRLLAPQPAQPPAQVIKNLICYMFVLNNRIAIYSTTLFECLARRSRPLLNEATPALLPVSAGAGSRPYTAMHNMFVRLTMRSNQPRRLSDPLCSGRLANRANRPFV
jgi:hypothetical protein